MPSLRTVYSTAFEVPDLLQRDIAGTLTCPIYREAELVEPVGGTFVLRKPDGNVLTSGTVTVADSIAKFSISPATIAEESYKMGYRAEWSLELESGEDPYTFRNEVGIVRCAPWPMVSDRDLLARHTDLDRLLGGTARTTWQRWIEEAWNQLQRWLIQKGNRPHLIVQSSDLKDLATVWTFAVIFRDMASNSGEDTPLYRLKAEYLAELDELKKTISFAYSEADETVPDERRPAFPVTFLL